MDQITFQQLPEVVNRCLKPVDPVLLSYNIQYAVPHHIAFSAHFTPASVNPGDVAGMQAFDIEVSMDDAALKARMTSVLTSAHAKQLAALDDEVRASCSCSCSVLSLRTLDRTSCTVYSCLQNQAGLPQLFRWGPTGVCPDVARESVP